MRYGWVTLIVLALATSALADENVRTVTQPVVINPGAPIKPQATPHGGPPGPLVILVGEAARQQQAAAVRAAVHHRRRMHPKTPMPMIGAH